MAAPVRWTTIQRLSYALFVVLAVTNTGAQTSNVAEAAEKILPQVSWRAASVVAADFTCRGKQEHAILGTTEKDIVVAVFTHGLAERPEVLRYPRAVRDARSAVLTLESLDYDPKEEDAGDLPGFRRSKTCKGLKLSDEKIDSAHIYWDHQTRRFDDWVR